MYNFAFNICIIFKIMYNFENDNYTLIVKYFKKIILNSLSKVMKLE